MSKFLKTFNSFNLETKMRSLELWQDFWWKHLEKQGLCLFPWPHEFLHPVSRRSNLENKIIFISEDKEDHLQVAIGPLRSTHLNAVAFFLSSTLSLSDSQVGVAAPLSVTCLHWGPDGPGTASLIHPLSNLLYYPRSSNCFLLSTTFHPYHEATPIWVSGKVTYIFSALYSQTLF